MGHPPVYAAVGGEMSNRTADGRRINAEVGERLTDGRLQEWGGKFESIGNRAGNGKRKHKPGPTRRSSGKYNAVERDKVPTMDVVAGHDEEGNLNENGKRPMPKIANPGNVVRARVGGGHMGSRLCHDNEAPFPEVLATFFVRSFAPEGGKVGDCFSGSGTTAAVALKWGRKALCCDLRRSQVDLTAKRLRGEATLFDEAHAP
jgi:hypothetical protein